MQESKLQANLVHAMSSPILAFRTSLRSKTQHSNGNFQKGNNIFHLTKLVSTCLCHPQLQIFDGRTFEVSLYT